MADTEDGPQEYQPSEKYASQEYLVAPIDADGVARIRIFISLTISLWMRLCSKSQARFPVTSQDLPIPAAVGLLQFGEQSSSRGS